MIDIEKQVKEICTRECEESWANWKIRMLALAESVEEEAPGLAARVQHFTELHKASFFKGFQKRLERKVDQLVRSANRSSVSLRSSRAPLADQVERAKLEAYLVAGKNVARAAKILGIQRTTLSMWVTKNQELISAEERKSL